MNYFKTARFFLYIIPLGVVIVSRSTLFPFIVGKYVWFRTLSALALIFFLLGLLLDRQKRIYWERFKKVIKHPLSIAVGVFILAFVISGFFGVDPHFSFWSDFERGEGGLQMLHFFAFFTTMITLFKSEKNWRKFLLMFIVSAFLMIFYGLGAGLKYVDAEVVEKPIGMGVTKEVLTGEGGFFYHTFRNFIGPSFSEPGYRFQGSIGNPSYVAIYLMFAMFFAGCLLASRSKELKRLERAILIISIAIFLAFFILAATRGAFLGLIAGVFTGFLYLGFSEKSWRKPALGILVFLVILGSLGIYFKDTDFVKSIPGSRIFDISISAQTFQHRAIMWGIALEGFKERPVFGWGPGNFLNIFQQKYNPAYFDPSSRNYGAWFDRAHSIIFDYLAETGIVGLFAYLGMFVVLFWQIKKFKTKDHKSPVNGEQSNVIKALLIAMPVAYLVQGLVLFDVSTTYTALFIFLAFAVYVFEKAETSATNHQS